MNKKILFENIIGSGKFNPTKKGTKKKTLK